LKRSHGKGDGTVTTSRKKGGRGLQGQEGGKKENVKKTSDRLAWGEKEKKRTRCAGDGEGKGNAPSWRAVSLRKEKKKMLKRTHRKKST